MDKINNITSYISLHGLFLVISIIGAILVAIWLQNRSKIHFPGLVDNLVITAIIGIIGARLSYFLLYREQFQSSVEIFNIRDGGLTSLGGFLAGGLYQYYILKKRSRIDRRQIFDIMILALFAGIFLGRIGDLILKEYAGFVQFSKFSIPISALESTFTLLIFVLGLVYYHKNCSKGAPGALMILSYSSLRFISDFSRNETKILGALAPGQLVLLIISIISLISLVKLTKNKKGNHE